MKRPEPFEVFQPASIPEARELFRKNGPGGHFLAGGTDLVIAIKEKGLVPRYVVDLKKIPSLTGIREGSEGSLTIGALTTMREIETSPVIRRKYAFLAQSAAEVGSIQIRHRATIGGNMANATPSADVAPALLVLNAKVKISRFHGEKIVLLEEFFIGPGKTIMEQGDVLTEILIPPTPPDFRGDYIKFSPREMMDLAYVGVAVGVVLEGSRRICRDARIALCAVSPIPMRARKAETLILNQEIIPSLAERVGEAASNECKPISDVRSSAAYRREMVRVNTKRALLNVAAGYVENLSWMARRDRRY
jgi:carbon-monoxide dehydrogenase medium subunit